MQNFGGMELLPGLAPGCPPYKGGLALPRVAQHVLGCPTGFDPVPAGSQSAMQSHYTTGTTGTTGALVVTSGTRVEPL